MNRELWVLAAQSLRRRRKNSLLLFAVLFLSFAFSVASLAVTRTMTKTNEEYLLNTYGAWQGAIIDGSSKDEEFLRGSGWMDKLGITRCAGTFDRLFSVGTANEEFFEMSRFTLQSGRMPRAVDEIAMEANALDAMGYELKTGQTITLTVSFSLRNSNELVQAEVDFKLCGVLQPYSDVWDAQSGYGYSALNNAYVTEEGFQRVRDAGNEQVAVIRQEAQAKEDAGRGRSGLKMLSLGYTQTHYFFTFTGDADVVRDEIEDHFTGGRNPWSRRTIRNHVSFNYLAYGESLDPAVTTTEADRDTYAALIYTGFVFLAVLLAIFCIYAVQMQKQVRQFALFRSIGITRRQLRKMMLFETVYLCVPAAGLGALAGTLGAGGMFVLLGISGSASVQVAVPWDLVLPMALAWLLGVLLARLVILQIALREPLTGRIGASSKKLKGYRLVRVLMAGALGALLCASLTFTVAESFPPARQMTVEYAKASYQIQEGGRKIQGNNLKRWESILGVTGTRAVGELAPNLCFEGEEDAQAFQDALARLKEGDPVTGVETTGEVNGQRAIRVQLYVLPDDALDSYLDLSGTGMDMEAFRRGELVAVSFPQEPDGSFYMNSVVYKKLLERSVTGAGEETKEQEYTRHKDASDTGLRPGSIVTLEFMTSDVGMTVDYAMEVMGYTMEDFMEMGYFPVNIQSYQIVGQQILTPPISAAVLHPTVGAVVPVPSGTDTSFLGLDENIYVFWCSETFARNLLDEAAARLAEVSASIGPYTLGEEFGFTSAEVFADTVTGKYTDVMLEQACGEQGFDFYTQRKENIAEAQEHTQSLILLVSSGGCITLLLLLVLGNTLVMESERLKKNYGILQALGMSRRQLKKTLLASALRRGLAGAAFGWLCWGGYVAARGAMLYLSQKNAPLALRYQPVEALRETLWRYLYAGAGPGTAALLTVLAVALVGAAFLFANRGLFRENLMDKLREEV